MNARIKSKPTPFYLRQTYDSVVQLHNLHVLSDSEIAQALHISLDTVNAIKEEYFKKTNGPTSRPPWEAESVDPKRIGIANSINVSTDYNEQTRVMTVQLAISDILPEQLARATYLAVSLIHSAEELRFKLACGL